MGKGVIAKCEKCLKPIDFNKDLFVCLGTYEGDHTVEEKYFHMICWRQYFEEKARDKAQAVVNGMQEKMMPMAKQLAKKLKEVIGQRDDESGGIAIIN